MLSRQQQPFPHKFSYPYLILFSILLSISKGALPVRTSLKLVAIIPLSCLTHGLRSFMFQG
jgi:hypothetical protein